MSVFIAVAGLTKRYGSTLAVDGVGFEVAAGTIFGLLGPNGAGKTTILECLSGLRQPDGGSIVLAGVDARAEPARARQRLGVALQATALQDRITPREALALFGAFYEHGAAPETLLTRFSLQEKADAPYESLSAGQRQRLALALAMVNGPKLLLLDEPTAGLDPASRRGLHEEIRRLRTGGHTVLLTTHSLEEAHSLCDSLAILRAGRIVAAGRPSELIARAPALPRITLHTATPVGLAAFRALPGVSGVEQTAGGVAFHAGQVGQAMTAAVGLLEREGNALLDVQISRPSLEDAFLALTDNAREEPAP